MNRKLKQFPVLGMEAEKKKEREKELKILLEVSTVTNSIPASLVHHDL